MPSRPTAWNSATKKTSRWRNPGCPGCRAISTSSSSTRWARTSAARAWTRKSSIADPAANTTPGPDCRRSGESSFATWIPQTHGNALGIGMADVTTDRLVRHIDWEPTRVNALSSGIPSRIRVPAHFAERSRMPALGCGDRRETGPGGGDASAGFETRSSSIDWRSVRTCAREIDGQPQVEVEGEIEVDWDETGNLVSPFSVRAGAGHV